MKNVRKMLNRAKVRIAPSPTGTLHIGTARVALFNYLFAKKNNGRFILRFEDTDSARSKIEFEKDIVKGLNWLGLNWDGEIIHQKDRLQMYSDRVEILIKKGLAYKKDGAIWFKMPEKEKISWDDMVRGKIEFNTENDKDFVIVRSDNIPLFAISNVIDDYEIDKITHIIRGEDHISNTPRQILIARAFGYQTDEMKYAHLPMILNKDRSKMSKRKDPVSISRDFQNSGYLPEAMINFMALLGWNSGDDKEVLSLEEIINKFEFDRVGKSPAIFDIEKLNWLNGYYIRNMNIDKLYEISKKYFISHPESSEGSSPKGAPVRCERRERSQSSLDSSPSAQNDCASKSSDGFNQRVLATIKDRLTKLSDIKKLSKFYYQLIDYKKELLIFKKSAVDKTLKGLLKVQEAIKLSKDTQWESVDDLNILLSDVVKKNELTNGDVFWPVRVALSGLEQSPSPAEILWALGKEESAKRIEKGIGKLDN